MRSSWLDCVFDLTDFQTTKKIKVINFAPSYILICSQYFPDHGLRVLLVLLVYFRVTSVNKQLVHSLACTIELLSTREVWRLSTKEV